jgi:hypothetical protein
VANVVEKDFLKDIEEVKLTKTVSFSTLNTTA